MSVSESLLALNLFRLYKSLTLKKIDVVFFAAARQALVSRPSPPVLPRLN